MIVKHRLYGRLPSKDTEILFIGTFNPCSDDNAATFFYGRSRNYFWELLPKALGDEHLKKATDIEKQSYIKGRKIDLLDLISEVDVENPNNYDDRYLDDKVTEDGWNNILCILDTLKNLKKIAITRKTFSGIPNMQKKIEEIENYCKNKKPKEIYFERLLTPSRFLSTKKQEVWSSFINKK